MNDLAYGMLLNEFPNPCPIVKGGLIKPPLNLGFR